MRRKKVLAVIETNVEYCRALLRGIVNYSQTKGQWDLYIQHLFAREPRFYGDGNKENRNFERLPDYREWNVDGFLTSVYDNTDASQVLATNRPAVLFPLKYKIPNAFNLCPDNAAIGTMAAEYFLNRGFKNFAVYNYGTNDAFWAYESGQSFAKTIADAGFETFFYDELADNSGGSWGKERELIAGWLKRLPKPLAVWGTCDERGQHVVAAAQNSNLRIPHDVAILSVDNDSLMCNICNPPLSSIAVNVEKAGYEVAVTLDRLMKGKKTDNRDIIVSPTYVVTRRSTSTFVIKDKMVAAAVKFIHKNAEKMLSVADVVGSTIVSRRVLEMRFNSVLNRSILDEIKRVRSNLIAQTLLKNDAPIADVAAALNFPNANHMSRYFRREKKINPLAYRKLHSNQPIL